MVVEKGRLKGKFEGFRDTKTIFHFSGGGKWRQAEYKYHYHYAYMPQAEVVQDGAQLILRVDGMTESVQVVRA
ncbi:hypothetical protein HQ531_03415 [bacterium]|nr:hypothetical protein [bacterium]